MENYFPADVSLRVSGEIGAAQSLFPAARQLLFKALKMKATGSPVVRLFQPGTDGSLVQVFLIGDLKHVYVQPAKFVSVAEEVEEVEEQVFSPTTCPDMLSGVVVPGDGVLQLDELGNTKHNADGSDDYAIHEFHPTAASASVYSLNFAWQDVDRLGVETDPSVSTTQPMQVQWPKPSMYSGAMKRVVQALYGIGKTTADGPGQISDDAYADKPYYAAQNQYGYKWLNTDGIHKVGDVYWLIRISKEDGVLAMPLPLFDCTTGKSFAHALAEIGDVDTYAVVSEFGGLPTGETFPEDDPFASPPTAHRTDAIASGAVLQLLTAEEMLPFYRDHDSHIDKNAYFDGCGWAFSNTGEATSAHNTCWWYSRPDIAFATWWEMGWFLDGHRWAPAEDRFMRGEHWKVTLAIINADIHTRASGTAKLEMVEMQPVEAPNTFGLNSYMSQPYLQHIHSWSDFPFPGGYEDFDNEYLPLGLNVFGYGPVLPVTSFITGMGLTAYGNIASGCTAAGDFQHSLEYPGDHPGSLTILTGPGFIPNVLTDACTGYGFNPLNYVAELRTVLAHADASPFSADKSHCFFWTHSALMLTPKNTVSSALHRFTFWGRSQVGVTLENMEPAYAAPLHVFYLGEELEIVYRQAERWKGGHYTMGDFWATSLDLRKSGSYTRSDTESGNYIDSLNYDEGHVGLIIPQGVREGYVLLSSTMRSSAPTVIVRAETKATGVYAANNQTAKKTVIEYTSYIWDGNYFFGSAPSDASLFGLCCEVFVRWYWWWTSLFMDPQIRMAVSINAQTGEFFHMHDGPMRDWNPFDDFAFLLLDELSTGGLIKGPTAIPRLGYPRFRTNLPVSIALEDTGPFGIDPTDVTFVGGA